MSLPANIRVNVRAPFPSRVSGSGFITVAKSNGKWTIAPDYTILSPSNAITSSQLVALQDPVTKAFSYTNPVVLMLPVVELYAKPGDLDDTNAFIRAFAVNVRAYGTPGRIYTVNSVVMDGRQFDGRGCVVRDAVGASFCFQLKGFYPMLRDVQFQDQGHVAKVTTNSGGFASSAVSIAVSNATGMAAGQQLLIQGNGRAWTQTLISSVSGSTITLRDANPETGASGLSIVASFGLVNVGNSKHAFVEQLLFENARVGLIMSTTSDNNNTSGATDCGPSLVRDIKFDTCRYCAFAKYGNVHDLDVDGVSAFCGVTDLFTYTGAGVAGLFDVGYSVDLVRDTGVYVNNVPNVYGVNYTLADQFDITFLPGFYPPVGSTILIYHYHAGVRGFIEDQRNATTVVAGGNRFRAMSFLKCLIAAELQSVTLSDYNDFLLDTNDLIGLYLNNCGSDCNFEQMSSTWARQTIVAFNSSTVEFGNLVTTLTPSSASSPFRAVTGPEIYADATSFIDVDVAEWESTTYLTGGPGSVNFQGGQKLAFGSATTLAGGSSTYLAPWGQTTQFLAVDVADRNQFIIDFLVSVNNAPGGAETVTFEIIQDAEGGSPATLTTLVITGAAFSNRLTTPVACAKFHSLSVRVTYSAGAAASYPRGYFTRR